MSKGIINDTSQAKIIPPGSRLAVVSVVTPISAQATVRAPANGPTAPHQIIIHEVIAPSASGPDAPISGGGGGASCTITASISNSSSWSSVTSTAFTSNCTGASACYQTADMQANSKQTGNQWYDWATAPQTEDCTSSHASIISKSCRSAANSWSYRTIGYFTVFWDSGNVGNATLVSGAIGNTRECS